MLKDGPLHASHQPLSIGTKVFTIRAHQTQRIGESSPWLQELFQAAANDPIFACLRGVSATILFLRWGYDDDARMVTGSKDQNGQTWAVSVIRSLFREMGKTGSRASSEHHKVRSILLPTAALSRTSSNTAWNTLP